MNLTYGLGEVTTTPAPIIDQAKSAAQVIIETVGQVLSLKQQNDIFNLELKKAKALAKQAPPVGSPDANPFYYPSGGGMSQNTMLIAGGVALLAVFLLTQKRGR